MNSVQSVGFTANDIVAIKSIRAPESGPVYLGASRQSANVSFAGGREMPHPGAWCHRQDAALTSVAYSPDGRPGDFLAVSTTDNVNQLPALFGKLVALRQQKTITHLGVVRSDHNLTPVIANEEGGKVFDKYLWLEILAIDPNGVRLGSPFDDQHHAFNQQGGHYIAIDALTTLDATNRAELRRRIWDGFPCILQPSNVSKMSRPAWRP